VLEGPICSPALVKADQSQLGAVVSLVHAPTISSSDGTIFLSEIKLLTRFDRGIIYWWLSLSRVLVRRLAFDYSGFLEAGDISNLALQLSPVNILRWDNRPEDG
jgi:hypothetical protein